MAVITAVQDGLFSDAAVWDSCHVPTPADTVDLLDKLVVADIDINCAELCNSKGGAIIVDTDRRIWCRYIFSAASPAIYILGKNITVLIRAEIHHSGQNFSLVCRGPATASLEGHIHNSRILAYHYSNILLWAERGEHDNQIVLDGSKCYLLNSTLQQGEPKEKMAGCIVGVRPGVLLVDSIFEWHEGYAPSFRCPPLWLKQYDHKMDMLFISRRYTGDYYTKTWRITVKDAINYLVMDRRLMPWLIRDKRERQENEKLLARLPNCLVSVHDVEYNTVEHPTARTS